MSFINPILRNFIDDHERDIEGSMRITFAEIRNQERKIKLTEDFPSKKEYLNIHRIQPGAEYFTAGKEEELKEKYIDFFTKFLSDSKKPNIIECSYEQLSAIYHMIEEKIWPGIWCVICHTSQKIIKDLRNDLIPLFIILTENGKKFDLITYRDESLKTIIYSSASSTKHGTKGKSLDRTRKIGEIHFSVTYPIVLDNLPRPVDVYSNPKEFSENFGIHNVKYANESILLKFNEKLPRDYGNVKIVSLLAINEKIILGDTNTPKVYFIHGTFNSENMIEIRKSTSIDYRENRAKNIGLIFVDIIDNRQIPRLIDTSNPDNLTADYFCSDVSLFKESVFEPIREKFFERGLSPLQMISHGKEKIEFISFRERYFPDYKPFSPLIHGTMLTIIGESKNKNRKKILELTGREKEDAKMEQKKYEEYEIEEEKNYSKKSHMQKKLDMVLVERFLMMDGKNTNAKFPFLAEKISREEITVIQNIRNKYGEGKVNPRDLVHKNIDYSKVKFNLSVKNQDLLTINMSNHENEFMECSIYDCGIVRIMGPKEKEFTPIVHISGKIHSLYIHGYVEIIFDDVSKINLNTASSIYDDYPLYENFNSYSEIENFFENLKNENTVDIEVTDEYRQVPYKRAVVRNIYYEGFIKDSWGCSMILNRFLNENYN